MATQGTKRRHHNSVYDYENSEHSGYMASSYRPSGTKGNPGYPSAHSVVVPVGISASVGHDHWASDVIHSVVNNKTFPDGSGSNSPDSAHSPSSSYDSSEKSINDPSVFIFQKIRERKRKFHSGRPLELKNLPDGCTEKDIRNALTDLQILSVTIESNDGRYKPSAKIFLENPEVLDEWPESRTNAFVRNKEVSVCVGNSDGWLCVAKLPLDYTEEEFHNLASAYGKVREAFLMISERTGESKGYGLIKYVSGDAAAQARHLLDGRTVTSCRFPHQSYALDCDWLNSGHTSLKALHSKALYVDHLPPDYRDMGEFRRIFSVYKSPPYCQIAMPKGVIQDWGLVEFFDPIDSEITQSARNGYIIRGYPIRVHFCIPGVNAINIYMKAVNAPPNPKKKALLQDTPSADVYSQLQKLASQNPAFAENLQNIIQEQIRSLSSNSVSQSSRDGQKSAKVQQQHHAASQPHAVPPPPPTTAVVAAAPTLNANAQAALMILLTAQMQSQTGEDSILQNPQVVGILQNLVNQAGDPTKQCDANITEILSDPALSSVFRNVTIPPAWPTKTSSHDPSTGRVTLLETPKPARPILLGDAPPGYPAPMKTTNDPSPTPPLVANNLNNLLNAQNLNQLLGSLTDAKPIQEKTLETPKPARRQPGPRPVLLGDPPALPPSRPEQSCMGLPSSNGYSLTQTAPPQVTSSFQVQPQLPAQPAYVPQPSAAELSSVFTSIPSATEQLMAQQGLFSSNGQLSLNSSYIQAAAAQQQQQFMVANPFLMTGYGNFSSGAPLIQAQPPPQTLLYNTAAFQQNTLGYGPNIIAG